MYEWDEAKRQANLQKHGVDFSTVDRFEWEYSISTEDKSERHGEQRMISIGPIGLRLHVLVWTSRGETVRIISLRLANKLERKRHEKEF